MKRLFSIAMRCIPILFLFSNFAFGWGSTAHKFINLKSTYHLPESMADLKKDSLFYRSYASAPDYRKDYSDTSFFSEEKRHYIDIDAYPDFKNIPHSLDSMMTIYGRSYVWDVGTLPWAIVLTLDSIKDQILRHDYAKAESTMSDLGHYVADATQPLHCTKNYDGQLTGNGGIHSRYESGMITAFQSSLGIVIDSVRYIVSPLDYAFEIIYKSQSLVDSILLADTYAKNISGWSGSGTPPPAYYTALWEKTGSFTQERIQTATIAIASLWYTAWIDANSVTNVLYTNNSIPSDFTLNQNFPNPFNASTTISFTIPENDHVSLKLYNLLGCEVSTLLNAGLNSGVVHRVIFEAQNLPSGLYYYRLETTKNILIKKMMLLK